MLKNIVVAENQRGLLIRDGRLINVLEPGRYRFWDIAGRLSCELFEARGQFVSPWAELIEKRHPDLAERVLETVRVREGEVAVVSLDGRASMVVYPGQVAYFWKGLDTVDVTRIDVEANPKLTKAELTAYEKALMPTRATGKAIATVSVSASEVGLVFFDGELAETLGPGRYGFWQVGRHVTVRTVDTRSVPLEVTAQEILTKDRISLRVTLTAFVRVRDAAKAVLAVPDYNAHVYKLVQFAVRESVGGRTLDEVLNDRETVDAEIVAHVGRALSDMGVDVAELGIKDVILPGEMRVLINKVVEAEKTAQANVIQRREEVAATRSLLNTARLMENSPTLLRLKELEALERVTEKIGRMDVHTGGDGLNGIVDRLVSLAPRGEVGTR